MTQKMNLNNADRPRVLFGPVSRGMLLVFHVADRFKTEF